MRFLLTISILLLFSFQSIKAESVWLIILFHDENGVEMEKIRMKDISQCKKEGLQWGEMLPEDRPVVTSLMLKRRFFKCIEGK